MEQTEVAATYMLSPRMMYKPSTSCCTPSSGEKMRSWHSSRMRFVVWSKPRRLPTMLRPSFVMTVITSAAKAVAHQVVVSHTELHTAQARGSQGGGLHATQVAASHTWGWGLLTVEHALKGSGHRACSLAQSLPSPRRALRRSRRVGAKQKERVAFHRKLPSLCHTHK